MLQDQSRNRTPMPAAQPPAGAARGKPRRARAEAGIARMLSEPALPKPGSPEAMAAWRAACTEYDRLTRIGDRDYERLRIGASSTLWTPAKRHITLSAKPEITELDDTTIQGLVTTFRHHKLVADEARRRGAEPLCREAFDALWQEIAAREAELRDANARGDCAATHPDIDAMMSVLDAGLNIAFGSPADRRLYLAFVEAELEVMTIIRGRQSGATRPTTARTSSDEPRSQERPSRPKREKADGPTPEQILEGWKRDQTPTEKTFYTFSSKVRRWTAFLAEPGVTFDRASLSDASDWKIASLVERSAKSVSNHLYAVKAIYGWALANGKCPVNPFSWLKQPRAAVKGRRRSTKRDFNKEEAARVLTAARDRTGYQRWVPWIACVTGARILEICHLGRSDMVSSTSIQYFRMTTEYDSDGKESKLQKTKKVKKNLMRHSLKRSIPLNPGLIEEGFLDFFAACNDGDLFSYATLERFHNRGAMQRR